ncbi:MAG: aldo/keto reductase [Treponema sp.]|jgi:predicted aldo/keto reductase-like oxidoreductase|nr:aldo/keto reductase [Treponema sp.]
MEYRLIGKTGIKASVIGLGIEGIARVSGQEAERVIGFAIDRGINIIDCCMPALEVQEHINRALRGRREKMLIQGHIGSSATDGQYDVSRDIAVCRKNFENLLSGLGTDYIDFGMFFFVDTPRDFSLIFEGELLRYAEDMKKRGLIRAIGASCHNSEIAGRIAATGLADLIMFSVNPVFDMTPVNADIYALLDGKKLKANYSLAIDPGRAAFYAFCEQAGVSITVMKTLMAGKLLDAKLSPFGKAMSAGQCIHYALTRPAVASVLLGCKSEAEIQEALSYFDKTAAELDYSAVLEGYGENYRGNCLYCNHCQPCPSRIDIAALTRYTDIASLNEKDIPPTVTQHYMALEKHGSDCTACGDCEEKCPFAVAVTANMEKARRLFGV